MILLLYLHFSCLFFFLSTCLSFPFTPSANPSTGKVTTGVATSTPSPCPHPLSLSLFLCMNLSSLSVTITSLHHCPYSVYLSLLTYLIEIFHIQHFTLVIEHQSNHLFNHLFTPSIQPLLQSNHLSNHSFKRNLYRNEQKQCQWWTQKTSTFSIISRQ